MENTRAGPLAAARIIVLACLAREFCEAELEDTDHVARTMLAFGRYREEIWLVAPSSERRRPSEIPAAPARSEPPLQPWSAFVTLIASRIELVGRFALSFVCPVDAGKRSR